jgi:hypothetical protein
VEGRDEEFERVAEEQRTTKEAARRQGVGTPEPGVEPAAPSYADETGVTDLGVGEPRVPAPLVGDRSFGTRSAGRAGP